MSAILFKDGQIKRQVAVMPRPPAPRRMDREAVGLDTTNWFDSEKGELIEINADYDPLIETRTVESTSITDGILTVTYNVQPIDPTILEEREKAPYKSALENHLNMKAAERGYDTIHTAALRANNPDGPFYQEGLVYAKWMDDCNTYCYTQLRLIKEGSRQQPTPDELIAELPLINLPAPVIL